MRSAWSPNVCLLHHRRAMFTTIFLRPVGMENRKYTTTKGRRYLRLERGGLVNRSGVVVILMYVFQPTRAQVTHICRKRRFSLYSIPTPGRINGNAGIPTSESIAEPHLVSISPRIDFLLHTSTSGPAFRLPFGQLPSLRSYFIRYKWFGSGWTTLRFRK